MIADAVVNLFRRAAFTVDLGNPRDPLVAKMFGLGMETKAGIRVDEEKALGYPAVWRGVNILSNGVAKLPLDVFRRVADGKEKDTRHPAYRLLRRKSNPQMTAAVFRKTLQQHALLWGNGFAHIWRDGAGRPLELTPMLPDRTALKISQEGDRQVAVFYVTQVGGETFQILPENVLHIRGLSFNGLWGWDVVTLLKESIGLGLAAREFGARFFNQSATASGVIMVPGHMTEEAEKNFRTSIGKASEGLGQSHKILFLEEGAKFQQLTIPPDQAQFLSTREFEVRQIASIIGIQAHKLGDPTRTSFSSLEQSNQEHLDDDLDPWLVEWEQQCEDKLLTEEEKETESHTIEFNRKAFARSDLSARTSSYATGRQWGWLSVNDVRRAENLDPLGDEGDVYLVPANMVPADQAGQLVMEPPPEEDQEEEEPSEEEQEPTEEKEQAAAELRSAHRALLVDVFGRIFRRLESQARAKATSAMKFRAWLAGAAKHNEGVAMEIAGPALIACRTSGWQVDLADVRSFLAAFVQRCKAAKADDRVPADFTDEWVSALEEIGDRT